MPICLKNIANLKMLPPDLISKLTPDLILKLPPELISKLPPGLLDDKTVCVYVQGYYKPGEGGEGSFFWDDSSLEEEDSGIIFKPDLLDSSKKGRWKRIFNEPISVKWFGARGDKKGFDTDAIKKAIKAVKPGGQLIIPSGTYLVSSLLIDHAISLEG